MQASCTAVFDEDDDVLSILSCTSPARSRVESDLLFKDIDDIISKSAYPPVGTTLPPLYRPPYRESSRRGKRLVNKPLRRSGSS